MRDDEILKEKIEIGRGRPREYDEDHVMTALLDLFWNHGYEGTSLSDIMKATGLKKGSLYSLFGGKRDMYLKALTRYDRDYVAEVCHMLTDKTKGAATARLDQFLSLPIHAAYRQKDERGCFLCNASAEMAAHDEEMRVFIKGCYDDMAKALAATLTELYPQAAPEAITARAGLIVTVYSGLRIMSRSQLPRDFMEDAKRTALDFQEV